MTASFVFDYVKLHFSYLGSALTRIIFLSVEKTKHKKIFGMLGH